MTPLKEARMTSLSYDTDGRVTDKECKIIYFAEKQQPRYEDASWYFSFHW